MTPPLLRMPWGEVVAWAGPWPPTELMYVVIGKRSGGRAFTTDEILAAEGFTLDELRVVAHVTAIRRVSYSTLPEEVDAHPHVARCAEYEEVKG